jgi:hypothetical protein
MRERSDDREYEAELAAVPSHGGISFYSYNASAGFRKP